MIQAGGNLVVGAGDGTVALLNKDTLKVIRRTKLHGGVSSLILNAAGDHVFVGNFFRRLRRIKIFYLISHLSSHYQERTSAIFICCIWVHFNLNFEILAILFVSTMWLSLGATHSFLQLARRTTFVFGTRVPETSCFESKFQTLSASASVFHLMEKVLSVAGMTAKSEHFDRRLELSFTQSMMLTVMESLPSQLPKITAASFLAVKKARFGCGLLVAQHRK